MDEKSSLTQDLKTDEHLQTETRNNSLDNNVAFSKLPFLKSRKQSEGGSFYFSQHSARQSSAVGTPKIQQTELIQREDIIQKMREEIISMGRQVKSKHKELESTKLKHERLIESNNQNFYRISQQIKESINVKQAKQNSQIEHLKTMLNQNQQSLDKGLLSSKFPLSPQSRSSYLFRKESQDKLMGNFRLQQLETVIEKEQKPQTEEKSESNLLSSPQFQSTENLALQEKQQSEMKDSSKVMSTYYDIPDESKIEEMRKFFISSDLTNLNCNKYGERELNLSKKVKLQKAKLHSMFLFSPAHKNQPTQKVAAFSNLQRKDTKRMQTLVPTKGMLFASPQQQQQQQQIKSAQKQFNQNLTINYHHTKASSLVSQFFEFKEDKTDSSKGKNDSTLFGSRSTSTNEQTPNGIKSDFLQHSADFHFYSLLLDMSKTEKSIIKVHSDNIFLKFVKKIAQSENEFRNFLMNLTPSKYSNFFESIQHVVQNELASLQMILKMKRIILSVQKMHSSVMLTDAFNTIIFETCQVLNCDRASVFLIDPRRNELWTKVAKNSKQIRVQIGKGLVGLVAQTGETLNILDAHQDSRFNSDADKNNNYRTKSVLCLPIKDQNQVHIIGVLQAINKKTGDFFTKEDEGLLLILSQLATAVLRNSLYHDEREAYHNSLKSLVLSGIDLSKEQSLKAVMVRSVSILLNRFDVPQANVWLYNDENDKLVRYFLEDDQLIDIQNSQINDQFIQEQTCNPNEGIIGKIFENSKSENIINAYQHCLFNGNVDINTSMPIITIILKAQLDTIDTNNYKKIGVLQCINPKGLESLVFSKNTNNGGGADVSNVFYEILEYFGQIIGDSIKRFVQYDY